MLPRSLRYCCIIGVSASRIISELNHATRIASLECQLVKIPCLLENIRLQSDATFMHFDNPFLCRSAVRFCLCRRSRNAPKFSKTVICYSSASGLTLGLRMRPCVAFDCWTYVFTHREGPPTLCSGVAAPKAFKSDDERIRDLTRSLDT